MASTVNNSKPTGVRTHNVVTAAAKQKTAEPQAGSDARFQPITADERDDDTRRTITRSTTSIGAGPTRTRGEPPLPEAQGDTASLYAHDVCEPPVDQSVQDRNDALVRRLLVGGSAVAHGADAGGHGFEHAAHIAEQTGHAVETAHHVKHASAAHRAHRSNVHHEGHSLGGRLLGGAVSVALVPGATYFAAKDVKKAMDDTTAENVVMAAGSVGFATSLGIGAAKSGMALAKVGARFTPGLNVAAAAADAVWAAGVMADSKASTSKKVAAGVSALGSAVSATNIPIASQIGAAVATGGALLSTFL